MKLSSWLAGWGARNNVDVIIYVIYNSNNVIHSRIHPPQDQRVRSGQTLNSIAKLYDKNSLEQRSYPSYKTKLKSMINCFINLTSEYYVLYNQLFVIFDDWIYFAFAWKSIWYLWLYSLLSGLISNSICETQQEIDVIQKALNKISKMEAGKAAAAAAAAAEDGVVGDGSGLLEGPPSPGSLQSQQPRKTMRRGFFMTMLQRKANQVLLVFICW